MHESSFSFLVLWMSRVPSSFVDINISLRPHVSFNFNLF